MKHLLLLFMLLIAFRVTAQHLPELGPERVRLNSQDKNILAEVAPLSKAAKAEPEKLYYWYSSGSIQVTQGGYDGHLLNGAYTEFYLNKNLKEQGSFKKGLKNELWKEWSPDGTLLKTITWKNGALSGPFRYYATNGRLQQDGSYRNGLLEGPSHRYTGKDSIETQYYHQGRITSPRSFFKRIPIFKKRPTKKNSDPTPAIGHP
jgi:hypothetical protein